MMRYIRSRRGICQPLFYDDYIRQHKVKSVKEFADKARRLAKEKFPHKKLRLGYFSKHGFEEKLKPVLESHGIISGS